MLDEEGEKEKEIERMERKRYKPYKFSGKSYTFDIGQEKNIIDQLRQWGTDYFSNYSVITKEMYKTLKEVRDKSNEKNEFDLLCKVLKIFEKDEHSLELRIKDISQE